MKHNKLKSVKQNMVETLELPKDLMYGVSIVTITGRREVLIENYKGILSYTCHEIIVKGHDCKYSICGDCLSIVYFSNEDMKISGRIEEVKVSR